MRNDENGKLPASIKKLIRKSTKRVIYFTWAIMAIYLGCVFSFILVFVVLYLILLFTT